MKKSNFQKFALVLFFYTLLVILWGAWVRISHSGDGCGDTWPLCHGQLIPEAQRGKTWVEYAHRLMSGLYGFIVIYFYYLARKFYSKSELPRKAAFWVLIFMITEASLGAKLVLFKLVATNDTPLRVIFMSLHQVNSLLLSGAVTLAYLSAANKEEQSSATRGVFSGKGWLFVAIFFCVAITGAWAALSSTLFPTQDLLKGLNEDFSSGSHYLVRLRGFHPLMAIFGGGGLGIFLWVKSQSARTALLRSAGEQGALAFLVGLGFGISTLLALSPTWMKITHLAIAQIIWFFLIRFAYAWRREHRLN